MKKYLPILLLFILVSCTGPLFYQKTPDWQYTDLKGYDPADASEAEMDIIAIYTRTVDDEFQIRLDYLEFIETPNHDLYLALDDRHGGSKRLPVSDFSDIKWDILIRIPSSGSIQVTTPDSATSMGWGVRVTRDSIQDNVQVSLKIIALHGSNAAPWAKPNVNLQAFTTHAGSNSIADRTEPISSNAKPPLPAQVLFAFYNTLPAYSPSMALRKWDGAHTGPLGGRHGLFNLLRTANNNDIPLVLLDLNSPPVLSTLEFFGGMELIQKMEQCNLLIIPQALPESRYSPFTPIQEVLNDSLEKMKIVEEEFGINSTNSIYSPDGIIPSVTAGQTLFTKISSQIYDRNRFQVPIVKHLQSTLIPIPDYLDKDSKHQARLDGLSIEIKRSLIHAAYSTNRSPNTDKTKIVILGGNLPESTWGVPEMARAAFQYINAHPWIHPLNNHELKSLPQSSSDFKEYINDLDPGYPGKINNASNSDILDALINLPQNALSNAAWDAYWAFFNSVYPYTQELVDLRSKYIPHIWVLIAAAKWSAIPYQQITCHLDIDSDDEAECLLASESAFIVIEPVGGYISFMFTQDVKGPHQVIGPTSQFITGTSDPIFWDLSQGIHSDPGVIPGAFEDPGIVYESEIHTDGVRLTDPTNLISKQFALKPSGLTIEFQLAPNLAKYSTKIPVVIDPWQMYTVDWDKGYEFAAASNEVSWEINYISQFIIRTTGNMSVNSFLQSRNSFSAPENPNIDYPPGHYLPFPVSLVNIFKPVNFTVDLIFNSE